jgi:glycosyltransferase involved in cell wall biosynthesis
MAQERGRIRRAASHDRAFTLSRMRRRYRVALDARRLAGNRRGMGQYVHNLVRRLPATGSDMEFLLLVDRPLPVTPVPSGCRQVVIGSPSADSQSVSGLGAKLRSVYWMNALVPSVLVRERVDLFHGTNIAIPLVGVCRSIVTIPDLVYRRVPDTLAHFHQLYHRLLVPAAARRADRVIAISDSTRHDLIELVGVPPSKIARIYLAADSVFTRVSDSFELMRVRRLFDLPERFILHVGAVERQKRLEPMLRSAARLLGRGLIDGVVLAGEEGRGAGDVRRVVAELGIEAGVRFLGYVGQEFVPALYALARCTVYPSWYEGFGMPVLEAMACGSPVITSNTSSLPEVAGDAAILVSPGDSAAIERALERVLLDDRLRRDLAAKGIARAMTFSWDKTTVEHVELYRKVLAGC